MAVAYLPEVQHINVPTPDEGKWKSCPDLLGELKADLVYRGSLDPDVISAIPTIWARAFLFWIGLRGKTDITAPQVLSEWKGALGLLALGKTLNLDMRVWSFHLEEKSTWAAEHSLYTLAPSPEWRDGFIITVHDEPLIISSPFSLVFTPKEYECPASVPFQRNGRLADPAVFFKELGAQNWQDELTALRLYVERTRHRLGALRQQPNINVLVDLLKEWENEIRTLIPTEDTAVYSLTENPWGLQAPYDTVDTSVVINYWQVAGKKSPSDAGRCPSDFLLGSSQYRDGNVQPEPPIVIWMEGWRQPKRRMINSQISLGLKYPEGPSGTELTDGTKYPWIKPLELFFTPSVAQLRKGSFEGALGKYADGFVYPYTAEIMNYFTPEEIVKNTTIAPLTDGGVKVELRVPLMNHRLERRGEAIISKTYAKERVMDEKNAVVPETIAIWPNFSPGRGENQHGWKKYFLYARNVKTRNSEGGFTINPIVGTASTRESIETFTAEIPPYHKMRGGISILEIVHPPSGISLFNNERSESVGLILLCPLPAPTEARRKWEVGVDFGTSNTAVFFREDGGKAPLSLQARLKVIYSAEEPHVLEYHSATESFHNAAYVPDSDSSDRGFPSFSSIFRVITHADNMEPIKHGRIIFIDRIFPQQFGFDLKEKVLDKVKWARGQQERHYAKTFLWHCILMVCAEAYDKGARSINLHWAYPSAFSESMSNTLGDSWNSICTNLMRSTGIEITLAPPVTESVAIAKWRVFEGNSPGVVMDIGGGTTDIAIWMNAKLDYQCSIPFAGGLLSDFATKKRELVPALLKGVDLDSDLKKKLASKFGDIIAKHGLLNIILKRHGTSIMGNLATGEEITKELRSFLLYGLSSLFYYVGLVVAARAPDATDCAVYLAGNGSRLLSLAIPSRERLQRALASIMRSANPRLVRVDVKVSAEPKNEVAKGLLSDEKVEEDVQPHVILGEDGYYVESGGATSFVKWDENLLGLKDKIKNKLVKPGGQFPHLVKFTGTYDEVADKEELSRYSKALKEKTHTVCRFVEDRLNKIANAQDAGSKDDDALYIPLFIEEVRGFLYLAILEFERGEILD
jgi:hypothetical protein